MATPAAVRAPTRVAARGPLRSEEVIDHYLREQPIGRQILLERVVDARLPEARGMDQLHRWLVDAHPRTAEQLAAERRCAYCGGEYVERDNVGRWECRFHGGRRQRDPTRRDYSTLYRWTCCLQADEAPGCRRCDHSETLAWDVATVVAVPAFLTATGLVAPALPEAHIRRLSPAWRVAEIRHSADMRDPAQEAQYCALVLPDAPTVSRTDHYRRLPPEPY
jgi:hypothetical protein